MPAGPGLYHRANAILKRVTGNKTRAEMTAPELEAAIGWLERNRLAKHDAVLESDARYAWTTRQRREWRPPVGRAAGKPRGAAGSLHSPGGADQDARRQGAGGVAPDTRAPMPSPVRDGPS